MLRRKLPNGQVLLVHGRLPDGNWELELEGVTDGVTVGRPLNSTLADLVGYHVGREYWPTWIDRLADEIRRSYARPEETGPIVGESVSFPTQSPKRRKSRGKHLCRMCGGRGRVPGGVKVTGMGKGMGSNYGPCPACDGVGWVDGADESPRSRDH